MYGLEKAIQNCEKQNKKAQNSARQRKTYPSDDKLETWQTWFGEEDWFGLAGAGVWLLLGGKEGAFPGPPTFTFMPPANLHLWRHRKFSKFFL